MTVAKQATQLQEVIGNLSRIGDNLLSYSQVLAYQHPVSQNLVNRHLGNQRLRNQRLDSRRTWKHHLRNQHPYSRHVANPSQRNHRLQRFLPKPRVSRKNRKWS
ncbi:MAG: hypothetical protein LC808_40345 [Actinobacteria bacterium]|nr:hypothetical protein [Actinomycetota bacterium]